MPSDFRNAKVVVALMFAMTAGAALLRWLEPRSANDGGATSLLAESGSDIRSVAIEYSPPGRGVDAAAYDAVIMPDGAVTWQPRGQDLRVLMVGSEGSLLPEAQARQLLGILGRVRLERGDSVPVSLAAASDARETPELAAQAADLRAMLVRKAFIE
jgi:hypothetical protein